MIILSCFRWYVDFSEIEHVITDYCYRAQPFTLVQIGLEIGWVSAGLGKHVWAPGVQPEKGYKILFALELVYGVGITLIRISVVLFYHRIFGRERKFRIALWCTGGMLIAWFIAISAVSIFQCSPVQKQWDYTLPGHCLSFYGTFIGVTAPNVFIDLFLLLLPVPMLWKLQIRTTQKIALTANFLLGYRSVIHALCTASLLTDHISVIVVTIIRVVSITSVPDDGTADVTCTCFFLNFQHNSYKELYLAALTLSARTAICLENLTAR